MNVIVVAQWAYINSPSTSRAHGCTPELSKGEGGMASMVA